LNPLHAVKPNFTVIGKYYRPATWLDGSWTELSQEHNYFL